MSDPTPTREEMMSALFAHMIMQQTNMAMMLLGRMPHPQTGETMRDLEAARLFIDQIEMLQIKTKGNLNKEEESLLKQSLTTLQMLFVETVNEPAKPEPATKTPAEKIITPSPAPEKSAEPEPKSSGDDEAQKRFVKKY